MTLAAFCTHVVHKRRHAWLGLALIAAVFAALGAAPAATPTRSGTSASTTSPPCSISSDRVEVRYVLDQAEIPTVQERGLGRAEVLRRKLDEVGAAWSSPSTAAATALRPAAPAAAQLPDRRRRTDHHTRRADPRAAVDDPRRVELHDDTFPDRIGWKAIVSAPGSGTAVRTATPSGDPTGGLRRYPRDLLTSPARPPRARASRSRPGDGSLIAPGASRGGSAESRAESDGFAGLFADAASGQGVLLAAARWRRSAGARCTPSRPATARRWSPPTWSAHAAATRRRSCSARPSRSRTRSACSRSAS